MRSDGAQPAAHLMDQAESTKPLALHLSISGPDGEPTWDHSAQIIDFVRAVVEDRDSRIVGPEASEVLSSLRKLVPALEDPAAQGSLYFSTLKPAKHPINPPMPPLDAILTLLRWAKGSSKSSQKHVSRLSDAYPDHEAFTRIAWIAQILPLQIFTEICRKVYFAVDQYSEIDFILANGYLSYMFSEHVVVSGLKDYQGYCQLCRENLEGALSQLPLLLPASMDAIAALTLGVCTLYKEVCSKTY